MDDLTASLQALLRQHFHVTPTSTSRHDQWYKRASQSWLDRHKDRELLLLTPKVAREEWAPSMLQFSTRLATCIRASATAERRRLDAAFPPRHDKLFPDSVLDEPPLTPPLDSRSKPPLSPGVQRGDWWEFRHLADVACVTKALLEREQTAALVHLAGLRRVNIKDAVANVKERKEGPWYDPIRTIKGWGEMIDEALLIFFFTTIVGAFPEDLLTEDRKYRDWLPYGDLLSSLLPPMRFVRALEARPDFQTLRTRDDLQPHAERCVRILASTEVLYQGCELPANDWESRVSNAMLHFVGFEAWNRARQGESYLHCALNTGKSDKWLAHGLKEYGEEQFKETVTKGDDTSSGGKTKLVRPRDPLLLREPRVDPAYSDSEDEDGGKLAELEREEAEYGARRRTLTRPLFRFKQRGCKPRFMIATLKPQVRKALHFLAVAEDQPPRVACASMLLCKSSIRREEVAVRAALPPSKEILQLWTGGDAPPRVVASDSAHLWAMRQVQPITSCARRHSRGDGPPHQEIQFCLFIVFFLAPSQSRFRPIFTPLPKSARERGERDMERDPPEPGLSALACYACKRRKVKWSVLFFLTVGAQSGSLMGNRTLPVCSLCAKTESTCEYPTYAEKPGPKLGECPYSFAYTGARSTQKNKRRRSQQTAIRTLQAQHHIANAVVSSGDSTRVTTPIPQTSSPHQSNFWSAPLGPAASTLQDDLTETESVADPDGPIFSQIMYPSHDDHEKEQAPVSMGGLVSSDLTADITIEAVCRRLRIPESTYHTLMTSYFEYMTVFTLFKPHSIEGKFTRMKSIVEAEALVASMFAFSARFHASEKDRSAWNYFPAPSYFAKIAFKRIEDAFEPYDDTPPPLWLLQASVLETFYRLTRSVRSKSWRAMGNLVRLAYDLKLHLVDVDGQKRDSEGKIDIESWSAQEEQRRCWWAIWELDVFASTIRRLPLGMNWSSTYTFLPIPDSCWFENRYQKSCYLPQDATKRWKTLLESGNTSPRAWFIAINSLMHDAQQLVYNPETTKSTMGKQQAEHLTVIANCLYCTTTSLPAGLGYLGETLDFRTKAAPNEASIRQYHADIFGIHIMTQLTHFMIYHQRVCAQAPWASSSSSKANSTTSTAHAHSNSSNNTGGGGGSSSGSMHGGSPASHSSESERTRAAADQSAWTNYMKAAEAIVTLVRNSARDSYKYLNPFVANALWFAAAAQIACLVFGPAHYSKSLAASNYELLALSIDQCIEFWDSAEILKPRLGKIEAALRNMMHAAEMRESGGGGGGRGSGGSGGGGGARMEEMKPPLLMGMTGEYQGIMNMPSVGAEGHMMGGGDGMGGMAAVGPQQASTLSFLPMFQEMPLMSQLGAFDDLEYLFPYGVDGVWAGNRYPPPAV
ncbi:hypothetical protein PWT90_03160 [Aphanocladium album]|nr:hypothetical protein PWT90_03160 [Aphanocladium album]